jgi:gamma-glutamyltranspeptidase/glutathione hydrolase
MRRWKGGKIFMSLLVSSGELKIRSGRFGSIFGTLTAAYILVGCAWSLVVVSAASAASATPVAAEKGMVVSAHHLATEVGVDILKHGGSAIDAAVAVGYALAVVYPAAGNLGGGGFMTIWFADGRKTFLDFREKAPRAASRDMYLDKDGNVIKSLTTNGWLAVGVPGTVSGLEYARKKYGTMTRAYRAGDQAGRGWIRPRARRRRHARFRDRGLEKISGHQRNFSQPRTAFCGWSEASAA